MIWIFNITVAIEQSGGEIKNIIGIPEGSWNL